MAIWDRLTTRLRDAVDGLPPPPNGRSLAAGGAPSLAEKLGVLRISDESLGAELERRRRGRGRPPSRRPAAEEELDAAREARRGRMRDRSLSKSYAVLEVAPGAARGEIDRAFRALLRQYHPDRHVGDPEQHQSAIALATSLSDAYLVLVQGFTDRRY